MFITNKHHLSFCAEKLKNELKNPTHIIPFYIIYLGKCQLNIETVLCNNMLNLWHFN